MLTQTVFRFPCLKSQPLLIFLSSQMAWHVKTICFFITREFPVFPHKWYKVPLDLKQTGPASPDVYISEHMPA